MSRFVSTEEIADAMVTEERALATDIAHSAKADARALLNTCVADVRATVRSRSFKMGLEVREAAEIAMAKAGELLDVFPLLSAERYEAALAEFKEAAHAVVVTLLRRQRGEAPPDVGGAPNQKVATGRISQKAK